MANNLNTNPIYLDTFGSDIKDIFPGNGCLNTIVFWSGTAGDKLIITDKNGTVAFAAVVGTGLNTEVIHFSEDVNLTNKPYNIIVANGQYAATARALIYLC
jgi:hypothetical protein